MATHSFQLEARWTGGLHGVGHISSGDLRTAVSVPSVMGGPGAGTNPEELILGAAATCYLITLASALSRNQVPVERIELQTSCEVMLDRSLRLTRIVHRPHIQLAPGATAAQREAAHTTARTADQSCMITNAMRGNVEVSVEETISISG